MRTTQQNVPALRFPEFNKVWDEKKLGDISKFLDSKRIPLSENERNKRKGIYPYYGASGIIDCIDDYIFNGEFILLGEDGANILLRNSRLAFLVKGKVWINNHAHVLLANDSNYFLAESLERIRYEKYNTGTAQPKLNADVCKKIKLYVPDITEQQKIATFLSSVDTKIEQLNTKKALWGQYKKGMMQRLFNQEIRFKDEQGNDYPDWEEKRLGEIFTIRYGKDHKNLHDGDIPVMGTGGVIRYVDSILYNQPSVLIGRKGTIDEPRYIQQPFWSVDTLFYTEIEPSYIPFFIFLVVLNINWKRYNEATGVPSLNANTIIKIKVDIPCEEEQLKIANFLSAIDKKIELVAGQLKQAQTFKKGLLQQMFI